MDNKYTINDIIQAGRIWHSDDDLPRPSLSKRMVSFINYKTGDNGLENLSFIFNTPDFTTGTSLLDNSKYKYQGSCKVTLEIREKTVLFKVSAEINSKETINFLSELDRNLPILYRNPFNGELTLSPECTDEIRPFTASIQLALIGWAEIITGLINWYNSISPEFHNQIYNLIKEGTPEIINVMVMNKIITADMAKEWLTLREEMLDGKAYPNMNHCIE